MNALMSGLRLAFLSAMVMALPLTARAQFVSDSSASTIATADRVEYRGNITVLTGQVDVRQGDVRVLADTMEIYSPGTGGLAKNDFSRVVADGNFYYLTSDQEVRGEKGVYTKQDNTFVVTGDVILKQADGNVITGDKLYYNLVTRNARVVGTCKGRRCGSEGRVNILIKNTQENSGN